MGRCCCHGTLRCRGQHAAAVRNIGHGHLAQKNCAKYAPSTGTSLGAAGKLVKGKLVKSGMTLPKAYTLTFDITLKGKVANWGSVFHFTTALYAAAVKAHCD